MKLQKYIKAMVYLFLKKGEGDLVVMDSATYKKREAALDLSERLKEAEELRQRGIEDIPAEEVSKRMRRLLLTGNL